MKKLFLAILILLLSIGSAFALTNEASTVQKEYDGVWLLGFNYHKDLFGDANGKLVRQAIANCIDRNRIVNNIIGDSAIPTGIIPPGMLGYDPLLKGFTYDPNLAKSLLKNAGYTSKDKRLQNIVLLHTDGKKTKEIAKLIKKNLANIGIKIKLQEISYQDNNKWTDELEAGRYHLFLIGYKTSAPGTLYIGNREDKTFHIIGCEKTPNPDSQVFFSRYDEAIISGYSPCLSCKPIREKSPETEDLVQAIASSQGEINFGAYRNTRVEFLIEQLKVLAPSLLSERDKKLKEINQILVEDAAVVSLFYITRL